MFKVLAMLNNAFNSHYAVYVSFVFISTETCMLSHNKGIINT